MNSKKHSKEISKKLVSVYLEIMENQKNGGSIKDCYDHYAKEHGDEFATKLFILIDEFILKTNLLEKVVKANKIN